MKVAMASMILLGGLLAPLQAQESLAVSSSNLGFDPVQGLLMGARLTRSKVLLVVGDAKGCWKSHFEELFRQDSLVDAAVSPRFLEDASPAVKALREKHGWEAGPRWALLDGSGRVLDQGVVLPSVGAMETSLQAAGVERPMVALAAFVRLHPGHYGGLQALYGRQLTKANRRMEAFLKPKEEDGGSYRLLGRLAGGGAEASRELARPLSEADDRRIWGPVAELLPKLLRHPAWETGPDGLVVPAAARHSAVMREACRRLLPEVEAAMRRYPSQGDFWSTWVAMSKVIGQRSLRTLMASLEPLPGTVDFPPDAAIQAFVRECREALAWGEIKDLLLPRWRARSGDPVFGLFGNHAFVQAIHKSQWETRVAPLVEACLRMGDGGTADQVVQEAIQRMPSRNLPTWASQVALKAGHPQLAQAWAGLQVPEARAEK